MNMIKALKPECASFMMRGLLWFLPAMAFWALPVSSAEPASRPPRNDQAIAEVAARLKEGLWTREAEKRLLETYCTR